MSTDNKFTQEEVEKLLKMMKTALVDEINFPSKSASFEFDIQGYTKKDIFTAKIYRGKVNRYKYELGARIKKDGIMLLELHINPGNTHINPDGQKLTGSHWHIYSEKYGRAYAYQAENIQSDDFVENTIIFLKKFNLIEVPHVNFQLELL